MTRGRQMPTEEVTKADSGGERSIYERRTEGETEMREETTKEALLGTQVSRYPKCPSMQNYIANQDTQLPILEKKTSKRNTESGVVKKGFVITYYIYSVTHLRGYADNY